MIKHFSIKELVPEHIYDTWGENSWWFLDYRACKTLEWVREHLGSCVVNDWPWGGSYSQSGLRTFEFYMQNNLRPIYIAKEKIAMSNSQHKYGRGFDCKLANCTAEEARQYIKDNWEEHGLDWAITLEEGVSWLHFDCRNQKENRVYTFNP